MRKASRTYRNLRGFNKRKFLKVIKEAEENNDREWFEDYFVKYWRKHYAI